MIKKYKIVKIDYTVRDDNGALVDSTIDDEPLEYMHGTNQIIDGLEAALEGKLVSDKFFVRVEPEQGYGERDEDLFQVVDISVFEDIDPNELEIGMSFDADSDNGEVQVTIVNIEGNQVTVDGNHPLAGMALTFNGEILEVRDASPQEIELALAEAEEYE